MRVSSLLNLIFLVIIIVMGFFWFRDRSRIADLVVASAKWQKIDSLNNGFEVRASTWPTHANEGGTTIDTATAGNYIRNYQRTEQQMERNSTDFTQSIWVDAGSLSSMMKTIIEGDGDGIRIYFSKYPPIKSVPDQKRTDGGLLDNKNSIIIFTTKAISGKTNAEHQDVFLTQNSQTAKGSTMQRSFSSAPPQPQGYNYDGTCPPNTCTGTSVN